MGAAGQAAIERPQGIMGITLVCSEQAFQESHLLIVLALRAPFVMYFLSLHAPKHHT